MRLFQKVGILMVCISGLFYSDMTLSQEQKNEEKAEESKVTGQTFKFFRNQDTLIKNPFEMRDPFKRKRLVHRERKKRHGRLMDGNKFSNMPSIEGYNVSQIRVVGVMLGKERRAIAKIDSDGKLGDTTYILKEGMKLGENQAEIKAILPGGVVLVEKLRNVYDQDEYIETVIPISVEF